MPLCFNYYFYDFWLKNDIHIVAWAKCKRHNCVDKSICKQQKATLRVTNNTENSSVKLQQQLCRSGPQTISSGLSLRQELWSHVAVKFMGLQHENTHDFISQIKRAEFFSESRDRITQESSAGMWHILSRLSTQDQKVLKGWPLRWLNVM